MEAMSRWQKFKIAAWNWVRNSGTILWARVNMLVGTIWVVLSQTDLSSILNPKYLTYWLIVNGIITELVRRNGNTVQTVTVANAETNFQPVEIKRLERVEPNPPPTG
jgi:hypothetical protein